MRKFVLIILFFAAAMALAAPNAYARGGQSADDCPPGNKDPDCATH